MGEDHVDGPEVDGSITFRILDEIAGDFTQAKWWLWWKTGKCGSLISKFAAALATATLATAARNCNSTVPTTLPEKRATKKEKDEEAFVKYK